METVLITFGRISTKLASLKTESYCCHFDVIVGMALHFKGRFLEFRMYHYFANLFSKLSEITFYKEISKFQ